MKTTSQPQQINARIYGRFSSNPQEKGDSLRRQVDGAQDYAKQRGITIIAEPYFDKGVSGKAGKNLVHEFGRYLREAQAGEILLVEITDRIGRQSPFLLGKLLYDTVHKGIEIHFWAENRIINADNIDEMGNSIPTFVSAATGHEENKRKIFRINQKVQETIKACKDGKLTRGMIRFAPSCFSWDETKSKIIINEDKRDIIKFIFNEYCKGRGITSIARSLNEQGKPTFYGKQKWQGNNVKNILHNEAFNGMLNADGQKFPLLPKIITDEVWAKSQMLIARNTTRHGNFEGRTNNIFTALSCCKICEGKIRNQETNKDYSYYSYFCTNAPLKACKDNKGNVYKNHLMNAKYVEFGFFKTFFGDGATSLIRDDNRNVELNEKIETIRAKIISLEKSISNLYDMAETGDTEAKKRIALRQAEMEQSKDSIKVLEAQLTEDSQFEDNAKSIVEMVKGFTILKGGSYTPKDLPMTVNDMLADDVNRKRIAQILPTLFSKVTFDCQNNVIEAFSKEGVSMGSYSPLEIRKQVLLDTTKTLPTINVKDKIKKYLKTINQ